MLSAFFSFQMSFPKPVASFGGQCGGGPGVTRVESGWLGEGKHFEGKGYLKDSSVFC